MFRPGLFLFTIMNHWTDYVALIGSLAALQYIIIIIALFIADYIYTKFKDNEKN